MQQETIIIGGGREAVAVYFRDEFVPAVWSVQAQAESRADVLGRENGWGVELAPENISGGKGGWIITRSVSVPLSPNGMDKIIDGLPQTLASVRPETPKARLVRIFGELLTAVAELPESGNQALQGHVGRVAHIMMGLADDGTCPTDSEDDPGSDAWYRKEAERLYGHEGDLEIDDDAIINRGDSGAYVQAWRWIDPPESDDDGDDLADEE